MRRRALLLALVAARAANLFDAQRPGDEDRAWAAGWSTPRPGSIGGRWAGGSGSRSVAAKVALQKPWLGLGAVGLVAIRPGEERPWGLVGLSLGMYGVVGWALLLGVFVAPIAAFLGVAPPPPLVRPEPGGGGGLAGALAIVGLDAILNPGVVLVFASVAGALVGLKGHAEAASAWIRRAQGLLR